MNLKPLNVFLDNSLNLKSYELYKVVGELVLRQENHRTQEIQIQYIRNIEALLVEKGMTLFEEELKNQNKNENVILVNSTKIKNLSNLSIITNDENISFQEDTVYLIKINEEYFIVDEIFKNYDFSDEEASFITKIDLTNFKKINSNIKFVFETPKKLQDEWIEEISKKHIFAEQITLRFPNSTLINQISVNGDLELLEQQQNTGLTTTKNFILENKTPINILPLILNPFYLSNNEHNKVLWLSRFHNFLHHINFWNWMPYVLANNKIDLFRQILKEDNATFELLKKVIKNSEIQKNNFNGLSEEEITKIKNQYGTLDMSKINDYLLDVRIKEIEKTNIEDSNRLRSVILALSAYILSSFSIKGGLNEEHKLALPFYFEASSDLVDIKIKSEWFEFENGQIKANEKHNDGFLNSNLVFFNNEVIQFPTPPAELQEVNVSNLPIEFNTTNSANLNYIWYSFFRTEYDITKYLLLQQKNKNVQKVSDLTLFVTLDNAQDYLIKKNQKDRYISDASWVLNGDDYLKHRREVFQMWEEQLTPENKELLITYIKNSKSLQEQMKEAQITNIEIKEITLDNNKINESSTGLLAPNYDTLETEQVSVVVGVRPGNSGYPETIWGKETRPKKVILHPFFRITADVYYDVYDSSVEQKEVQKTLIKNKFVFNDIFNSDYIKLTNNEYVVELNLDLTKNNIGPYKLNRIKNIAITSLFGSWVEIIINGVSKKYLLNNQANSLTKIIDLTI